MFGLDLNLYSRTHYNKSGQLWKAASLFKTKSTLKCRNALGFDYIQVPISCLMTSTLELNFFFPFTRLSSVLQDFFCVNDVLLSNFCKGKINAKLTGHTYDLNRNSEHLTPAFVKHNYKEQIELFFELWCTHIHPYPQKMRVKKFWTCYLFNYSFQLLFTSFLILWYVFDKDVSNLSNFRLFYLKSLGRH